MNRCVCCGDVIPEGGHCCTNCKKKSSKRKEFIECLLDECEYWKDKENGVYGVVFSILVMIDGCSSLNNFKPIEIEGITNRNYLHDEFCALRSERNEKI